MHRASTMIHIIMLLLHVIQLDLLSLSSYNCITGQCRKRKTKLIKRVHKVHSHFLQPQMLIFIPAVTTHHFNTSVKQHILCPMKICVLSRLYSTAYFKWYISAYFVISTIKELTVRRYTLTQLAVWHNLQHWPVWKQHISLHIYILLMRQQFVTTHQQTILQQTKNKRQILNRPTFEHVLSLWKKVHATFFADTTFWQNVCL